MKKTIPFMGLLLISFCSFGQGRNTNWVFGHQTGLRFSGVQPPTPFSSSVVTRGSCASISDSTGKLLFYSAPDTMETQQGIAVGFNGNIYDTSGAIMQNGDSIISDAEYREMTIIPYPDHQGFYYLFSISVLGPYGLYYSIIDLNQNGGLGRVIQKNILLNSFQASDGLTAIKHGNGRDWWIIFRRWDSQNDLFYKYLVTPLGISLQQVLGIGFNTSNNILRIAFSKNGSKMVVCDYLGLLELYDFDRCTGVISNYQMLNTETFDAHDRFWSAAFSADESKLYVSSDDTTSYLYQFDLDAANIPASRQTIFSLPYPQYSAGELKLAPDNKIYFSCSWYDGFNFNYPYFDTTYNMYNMNLSVINQPNLLGVACDFQPFSFYLDGKRTYYGLPNNPDYELFAMGGSSCDTLGLPNQVINFQNSSVNARLNIFYSIGWQTAFINAQGLQGKNYSLNIFDIAGRNILSEGGKLLSEYFTENLRFNFTNGIYFVSLTTEKEKLNQKFIIE